MTDITNDQNYLDVRDIITRVEELRTLRQPGPVDTGNPDDAYMAQDDLFAELATLESLLANMKGEGGDEQWEGDWYPVTLIRDSYFEDAMDDMLEDCGYLAPYADSPSFINITVDYSALQMDYTSVDYDGVTYWYR